MTNSNEKTKWFNKTWLVILLCFLFFPVGLYALWKNQFIGKGWKIGVSALIGLGVVGSLGDSSPSPNSSTSVTNEITESPKQQITNESNWRYSEDIDNMDNSKRVSASIESDNSLKFDFPYGNSDFKLQVREWKGQTDIFLTCTKCQFIAGVMGENAYRMKFDDESPINVSANHSSSGSADIVFLGSTSKIIKKLKTATNVIIEPQFYEVGYKQVKFTTKDFKWN